MAGNARRGNGSRRTALTRWLRAQGRPCWICRLPIDYGAPTGDPLAFNCDEIVPVSLGGSPYDKANVDAAHACCNNWRKARSAREVEFTRAAVLARFGGWSSPPDFVAKARALREAPRSAGAKAQMAASGAGARTTTDWI